MVPGGHDQLAGHARCGTKTMKSRSDRRSASCNSVLMEGAGAGQDGVTFGDPKWKNQRFSAVVPVVETPHVLDRICW